MGRFENGTHFVLAPPKKSETFLPKIKSIMNNNGELFFSTQGILSRLPSGAYTFTTEDPVIIAHLLYAELCRQAEESEALPDLTIVQAKKMNILTSVTAANIAADQAALEQIQAGDQGAFCIITTRGKSTPRLLMDVDTNALKLRVCDIIENASAPTKLIRGRIHQQGDAELVVRSKAPSGRVQKLIGAWLARNGRVWPTISSLANARYQQVT